MLILKKVNRRQQKHEKLPNMQRVKEIDSSAKSSVANYVDFIVSNGRRQMADQGLRCQSDHGCMKIIIQSGIV